MSVDELGQAAEDPCPERRVGFGLARRLLEHVDRPTNVLGQQQLSQVMQHSRAIGSRRDVDEGRLEECMGAIGFSGRQLRPRGRYLSPEPIRAVSLWRQGDRVAQQFRLGPERPAGMGSSRRSLELRGDVRIRSDGRQRKVSSPLFVPRGERCQAPVDPPSPIGRERRRMDGGQQRVGELDLAANHLNDPRALGLIDVQQDPIRVRARSLHQRQRGAGQAGTEEEGLASLI